MIHKQRLNNRILSLVLALVMVLSMLPSTSLTTFAAGAGTPFIVGISAFYANGTDLFADAGTSGGTAVYYYYGNEKVYLNENGAEGDTFNGESVSIYAGGTTTSITADVTITVLGGSVGRIFSAGRDGGANINGNVTVKQLGGTITTVYGRGGVDSAIVTGNTTLISLGGTVTNVWGMDGALYENSTGWTLSGDAVLPSDMTITIEEGETITVSSDASLTNNGTIVNNGTITVSGGFTNNGTIGGSGSIVRNAAYIKTAVSGTPEVWVDNEPFTSFRTEYTDGKLYIYRVPAGNVKVSLNGTAYYGVLTEPVTETELTSGYSALTDIELSLDSISVGVPIELSNYVTVLPASLTLNTVQTYEVVAEKTTAAYSLDGSKLTANSVGTVTIKITVSDFYSEVSEEFSFIMVESENLDISLGNIEISANQSGGYDVNYAGFEGGSKSYGATEAIVITGESAEYTVKVLSGSPTVVLNNCKITSSTAAPFALSADTTVYLSLLGTNTLTTTSTANSGVAGLYVPENASVIIDGAGTLNANGGNNSAGIGGGYKDVCGNVTINGGTVNAVSVTGNNNVGTGIGGSTITINGGTVTATGYRGAGIGGIYSQSEITTIVTINGGTVTATSTDGAGIGGSRNDPGGIIVINGGTVTATSNNGAGIGGGMRDEGGTITINGGTVTATGNQGAGIGGGYVSNGGTVTITGGTVKASSSRGEAIGKGRNGSSSGTLTNGATNGSQSLTLVTITLAGVSGEVTVDSIDVPDYYGMNDVVTMDGGKLYLYLPADQIPTTITPADGTVYKDYDNDRTYVKECEAHTYTVTFSWADDYSAATYEAKCDVCAYNISGNATVTSSIDSAENCQEIETTTYTASCELGGITYSEDKKADGSVGAHPMNDKGYCDACDMAFDSDSDGYYEIWTPGHLNWFAGLVNGSLNDGTAQNQSANAILMADLDMSAISGYVPIGGTTGLYYRVEGDDKGYQGTFDGNGYIISNLSVTGSSSAALTYGVFGTLSGTVKHLGVENFTFTLGTQDCRAGGIAGQMLSGSSVTDCYVANSTITATNKVAGGIAGCNYAGTIENCYTYQVTVTASRTGGIVGDNRGDASASDRNGTVINCYTDASAIENSQRTGTLTGCTASVSTEAFASGEITYKLNGDQSSIVWYQTLTGDDKQAYPQFSGEKVYKVGNCKDTGYSNDSTGFTDHPGYGDNGFCTVCGAYEPAVLNGDVYEISNAGQLFWFAQQVNGGETTINGKLMKDIDLESREWTPIGTTSNPYTGTFDGQGFRIKNMTINTTAEYQGLFGAVSGGVHIKNLIIDASCSINAGSYSAAIVGGSTGSGSVIIENCGNEASVNAGQNASGIFGVNMSSAATVTIRNCYNTGNITATKDGGGISGWIGAEGCTVTNCWSSGVVKNGDSLARGRDTATFTNCYYLESLTASASTGINTFTAEQLKNGALTYLLNGETSEEPLVWYQTLTGDDLQAYPQFSGGIVYYNAQTNRYHNGHTHEWEYAAAGTTITVTCKNTDTNCPNTSGGSVTIAKPASLTYTGEAIEAVVTNLLTTGDAVTVKYTGNTTDGYPVNAGSYTASVAVVGGPGVSVDFTVEAATITGATVTVDPNADLTYTGSAITPAVTVTLDGKTLDSANYEVSYASNVNAGTATITVTGKGNYQGTATATFTIVDETEPTADLLVENNSIRKILNTLTFGFFFKDYVDVTVTADGTGSDVAKIEYMFSTELLDETNMPTEGWKEVKDNTINITPQNKGIIYVRVTDEGGNSVVVNSDGIVVYEDSVAVTNEVTYTYQENSDKDVAVTFNGNTVNSIVCGEATLAAGTHYTVDYDNGNIVLHAAYLDTLNAGSYTFTVSYDPMGIADSGVTDLADTTFAVKVDKAEISNASADVTAPEAGAEKQTIVEGGTNYSAAIEWDCDTEKFGYNTVYTATVMLTADENHKFTSDLTASGWNVVVSADGATATLTKTFEPTRKEKLTDISAPTDCTLTKYYTDVADAIKELPTTIVYTTESGSVTVNIVWACNNYDHAVTKTNTFTWAVKGGELDNYDANGIATTGTITVTNADAITVENSGENKTVTYSGSTYDVSQMFTIDKNAGKASYAIVGGTGEGERNGSVLTVTKVGTFVIKLTTAANGAYAAGEATATLTVNKGTGSGTVTIDGWTYGEDAKAPVVNSSTNGNASVTYLYESTDGKGYTGSVAPENAGSYKLTVTFAETDLYEACTDDATFTVKKADPAIGAVTAGVVNDTLDISAIALNRADTTVDGSFTVDAGQELKLGDNEIAYTFTPADTDNYERVTGKVTVTVKDTIAPTGKVTLGANSWNEFLNDITFGLFFKETQTVSVETSDSFSGVEKIEYYAASDVLDLDGVKALADDKWTVMDGSVNVTAEDAKQFIYYIRITDKSGNIGYLATNGAEFDTTAPVIDGVHNGVTYYTTQKVTVTDKNLDTVTLNGEAVTGTITLDGNKEATYIIVATDKAGNATTVTVTMKLTESLGAPLDGITEDNVTSVDKDTIQDVIDQVEDLLDDEDLTEEEKAVLEEIKGEAEKLIEKIEEVTGATDTENTEKVEDITPENVKPEDKTDLEKAKEDLEDALENNGDNYTEDEKKAIQEEIDRIDEALEVIDRVEKVEDKIDALPETITKDDTDDVDAAKKAYDELSDYEKTLIDPVVKTKLDDAVKAAEDVNKPADTNSPQTGDNTNLWLWIALLFVSGGAVITLTVYDRKRRNANSK